MSRGLKQRLTEDTSALADQLGLDNSTARIEIQALLQHVLQVSRAWLIAHQEYDLSVEQLSVYQTMLQRRLHGEPLAYILGQREFFGLPFQVTPATLIPRADTERLVELVLERIPAGKALRVLDLGTGSGAIALSIAHARPQSQILACDASHAALEVAAENIKRLGLSNVQLVHSNWFDAFAAQRFNLIVSNPPYIAANDPHLQQGDLRFEPCSALTSGVDGLDAIRHIIRHAHQHLEVGGELLLEHGYNQAPSVRQLLSSAGYKNIFSAQDLSSIERCTGGMLDPQSGAP